MLVDCTLYNGEHDMLEFRMKILAPLVDKFVIVEADHTFSGRPKPYHIDYVHIDPEKSHIHKVKADLKGLDLEKKSEIYDPSADHWKIEYQQRSAIFEACKDFSDDDFVLMGDVDEIPSREALEMMKNSNFNGIATFQQFFFYYNLRTLRDEMWPGTIWCPMKALREFGAQTLRDSRGNTGFNVERGGWHLSYMGGVDAIKRKIEDFSHQEYNKPEFTDREKIAGRVSRGEDLFDRGVKSRSIPQDFFSPYFLENVSKEWL